MKKTLTVFIVLLVFGFLFWFGYRYIILANRVMGYVILDINPSVELAYNIDGKVLEVVSINEDADIITSDLDLVGLSLEDATEKVIDAAIETGYINELSENNALVVTTSCENEEDRLNFEEKVIDKANSYLESKEVYVLVAAQGVDDEIKAEAEQYDVSYGKMLLVNRLIAIDPTLSKDELVESTVQDVQKQIQLNVQNRYEEANVEQEQLQNQWKEQKEIKIQTAEQALEQEKEQIWEQNKSGYGEVTPAEKEEILNVIVEQKKNIIKGKLEELTEEIQQEANQNETSTENKVNYPVIENGNKTDQEIQQRKR